MLNLKQLLFLKLFIVYSISILAQSPRALLNQVQVKLNKAANYTADINIKVDLPYITLMPINSKLYYKQKDNFKIDTKSIAILPKQGFLQLNMLVNDTVNYTAIFQSKEIINKIKTSLLNLIPNNDTSDVVLAKLWVDEINQVIIKSQVTTKSSGTIKTEYIYGSQVFYGLPDDIKFTVDIKKFKIPKALSADINTSKTTKVEKKFGEINIKLKNYQINKGIADSVFDKIK
ncbi:MAG: outer membrane lipoprotein-sorting protein [Bacteroidia bacterium]|nr:outer membrane lipoprotein-sorting protein [Bacteroidia bacterium]